MTKRLYFADPYVDQFEGLIVERLETPDGPAVTFKETFFYPDSGGQPHDLGTIDDIPVTRVIERGKSVLHILERFPEKDKVECRIDFDRRRDHMQQHSGQHLLSAAFLHKAHAQTLSFHLGTSTSTIDLDRAPIAPEVLAAVERKANRAVRRAHTIRSYFIKSEEAQTLKLRKAPEVEGILRIVDIEGFDRQACCGTHPKTTAEVGTILVRTMERFKSGTRVEFVCGDRAHHDHKTSVERIRSLAGILSCPEKALVETATKLSMEKKALTKQVQSLREEVLQNRAASWISEAVTMGGVSVVVRHLEDVSPGELRLLTIFLTKEPSRVALLGTYAQSRAHLVFGRSADTPDLDMAALLLKALPSVNGNGGGSPHLAQGGGPHLDGLASALQVAQEELTKMIGESRK